jgi:hypothetical protein
MNKNVNCKNVNNNKENDIDEQTKLYNELYPTNIIYYDLQPFFRYVTNTSHILDDLKFYKPIYSLTILDIKCISCVILIKAIISYEEIKNINIKTFKSPRQFTFFMFDGEPMYKQLENKDLQIIFIYEQLLHTVL